MNTTNNPAQPKRIRIHGNEYEMKQVYCVFDKYDRYELTPQEDRLGRKFMYINKESKEHYLYDTFEYGGKLIDPNRIEYLLCEPNTFSVLAEPLNGSESHLVHKGKQYSNKSLADAVCDSCQKYWGDTIKFTVIPSNTNPNL